jgi:glutamate N-acetyltransferase/amino-acid N-acetyltransferase
MREVPHRHSKSRTALRRVYGGVTAPLGFYAAGIHVGIKKSAEPDLALLVTGAQGTVAGVFTKNRVAAAPVLLSRQQLRRGAARAVIINSGNANACTGAKGLRDARIMAHVVAERLKIPAHTVFVSSTGVIGQPLPLARITRGIRPLIARLSRAGSHEAAKAIMTTDHSAKETAMRARIGDTVIRVGGIAKGSGMIHPDMATMLAFLTTDAAVERHALQRALHRAVDQSFNRISVDGDTSTNDTVLLIANGLAGNKPALREGARGWNTFQTMLNEVTRGLALQICRDGEGVTKVVEILIEGAKTRAEASLAARAIATSCLVKTALFGEDANWGRIMAAIGRSGARVDQNRIDLFIGDVAVVRGGKGLGAGAEAQVAQVVKRGEFTIKARLHQGHAVAGIWTTDLSYDYVRINASYRS